MTRPLSQTAWPTGPPINGVGTRKISDFTPSKAHANLRRTKRVEEGKTRFGKKIRTHHLIAAVFPLGAL